ncbi:TRAP transporter small permease [Variovorax sp. PCZ-1]|uniref:TRAP transporter small permease n=1 Tax=Variovorax sp. PCZ-1 TaxID=2835533 RepID=UPI001BCBD61A|nr:TRAP transporter small permease [Variovorax sp. PCZ-1]MBS7807476.1 TRAP transporter small permease [Variovorax sp. PCZ-1]
MQAAPASMDSAQSEKPSSVPLPQPTWLKSIGKLVDYSVILIGGALAALIFINVVLRVVGIDFAWLLELGEMMMVWVTFLGGAAAAQRGAHMTINEFLDKLTPAKRRWADAAVQVFTLIVLGVVFVFGIKIVQQSWGNVLTTLEWPMAWQYMPLPLGSGLMLLFVAYDLWLILRGIPREQRYPEDH